MKKSEIIKEQNSNKKRLCKKCGIEHPLTNFYIKFNKGNLNSYRFNSSCKSCGNALTKNRTKYQRKYNLNKKFNLTIEQYNSILISQNNTCAICGVDAKLQNKKLAVDHNHSTGNIRGLLCSSCNTGIGLLKDDIKVLNSAIKYLHKYK